MAASKPTSWLFTQNHIVFHLTISLGPYLAIWAVSLLTTELSSRSLTPEFPLHGIRSLIEFGNRYDPYLIQCSTPAHYSLKASPKTISRRTSYLRVRLEFLRYPHLIPRLFNVYEFGPPLDFTQASAWTWIGHSVSGLLHTTFSPYSDLLSLRLRALST